MLLEMRNIVKKYGELTANDNISFTLNEGEILAIIGENGAGKTTLMKILYGLEQPTQGEIILKGENKHFKNPGDAIANGIGMVQQHFMLFEPFTVAENIVYSKEPQKGLFMDYKGANEIVANLSEKYELPLKPTVKVEDMPVGLKQRVEILKVLYQNANIIIFDEPTAVLTPQEVRELLKTIKSIAAKGKSIIIITHKLGEVMEVADRAIVMRAGEYIAEKNIAETTIEELSYLMIGSHIPQKEFAKTQHVGNILTVDGLTVKDKEGISVVKNLSLHLDGGEIVGIAGVSGNGQSELVQAIFGLEKSTEGTITVKGQEIQNKPVSFVRKSGVALIPEDRYKWGSATKASIIESSIMAHHRRSSISKYGIINGKTSRQFAQLLVDNFSVKIGELEDETGSLSGGNAQKLIAARELMQATPLLIACEPTRGVDIGAMEYIHDQLLEKRLIGDGVLLVSSELSEIMKLSDRIYVMYEGEIVGELTRGSVSEEEIGLLMAGGIKNEK
ncbi:MAG: ABC transporter ATP-binding protein [Oscillospiraceae bacterium]